VDSIDLDEYFSNYVPLSSLPTPPSILEDEEQCWSDTTENAHGPDTTDMSSTCICIFILSSTFFFFFSLWVPWHVSPAAGIA
jgi:hypothetical protein